MPIDRVRITGVRGIRRELTLELGGASLVLRGDNGTGKSSIVSGLLWVLRGEQGPSISAKAGTEEAYRANVLGGSSSSQVTIDMKGGGSLRVASAGLEADVRGQALRAHCLRSSPFLLRKQLLRFLDDRPVDRFHYLETFLDLEAADTIREALLTQARQHESTAEAHRRTRDQHLATVTAILPREFVPKNTTWTTVVGALVNWAASLKVPCDNTTWYAVLALAARLEPLLKGETLARTRTTLASARLAWKQIGACPDDPTSTLSALDNIVVDATDASVTTLLAEAARHFLAHSDAQSCPVCKQPIDKGVIDEVQRRLDGLGELRNLRQAIATSGAAWKVTWTATRDAARAYAELRGFRSFLEDTAAPRPPEGFEALKQSLGDVAFAETVGRIGAPEIAAWFGSIQTYSTAWIDEQVAQLPTEDRSDEIRRLLQCINLAQKVELAVTLAESTAADDDALTGKFKLITESIRSARQDVARELLDEISALVGTFYTFIHPPDADDEVTGAPAIEVQRRSGGTAHLRGKFDQKDIDDPRWVYSDGHLDTVGICVFLALRRFRADRDAQGDPKLMVLDDIVLSVDLAHGRRLLDLLRTKFDDHQVFIFTHNGLFYDWCVQRLPMYKKKAIARWTLDAGPQLGEYLSSVQYIEQQMASSTSPKLLAQAVMNLMDEWLSEARFAYSLPVQAKRGEEYTLTDIWEPFGKKLKALEKALKAPIGRLEQLIDELQDLPRMRNRLAAHENDFAREYPLSTVRDMAQRALELVQILYCAECTNFAVPIPSAKAPDLVRCDQGCERLRFDRPPSHSKV